MTNLSLSMTESQRQILHQHLFDKDGNEGVAIALCGHHQEGDRQRVLVQQVHLIPHNACHVRRPDLISWPTKLIVPFLEEAAKRSLSVVKFHGHANAWPFFSQTDNTSDLSLHESLSGWTVPGVFHGSAILLQDGRIFGRWYGNDDNFHWMDRITVVGEMIEIFFGKDFSSQPSNRTQSPGLDRHAKAFGWKTTELLQQLNIGVVGCSGIGSPVIEQLARLGVGKLVLVDPDFVEERNLNRILNATKADADAHRPKVQVLTEAIQKIGFGTTVIGLQASLFERQAVLALAGCDLVFGCMDRAEGRALLNRLATFYILPYFDLGCKIEADGNGEIQSVTTAVHYLQPGKSSLLSRGAITRETIEAEGLQRTDPDRYEELKREKYIIGVQEERPGVISVNLVAAAFGVNEMLSRLHDFRTDGNSGFAQCRLSLSHMALYPGPETDDCPALKRDIGRGHIEPLLDYPQLSL